MASTWTSRCTESLCKPIQPDQTRSPGCGPQTTPCPAQVQTFAAINCYVEQEGQGSESRMRSLPPKDLLFQLPHLQRIQRRLLDCVPRGPAARDAIVLVSCIDMIRLADCNRDESVKLCEHKGA